MKSYKLPLKTLPYLSLEDHLKDLKEMIMFLEDIKINVSNTRISRYAQFLESIYKNEATEPANFFPNAISTRFKSYDDWFLYIIREIHELIWIVKGIKKNKPKGLEDKLTNIVSGSDFAALDKNDHSRNLQYELRIASYFCQMNWDVDLSTLTDIVVHAPKFNLFLECKKVTNLNKLSKRLNEARNQINNRMPKQYLSKPCYSFLCIDVTKVAFPHNGLVWGLTPEHTKDIIQDKIREISNKINSGQYFSTTKKLLNIWLQIHIPALVKNPPMHTTRFSNFEILNLKLRRKAKTALMRVLSLKESVIKDPREIPPKKLKLSNKITIPSGTTFIYKDGVVDHFLNRTFNYDPNSKEVLLSVKLNGIEYEFFSIDFYTMMEHFKPETLNFFKNNKDIASLEIIGALLFYRFPYYLDEILKTKFK